MNKSDLDRYRQQGTSALVDAYEKLASERDALAAHLKKLSTVIDALVFGADREPSEENLFNYIIPQDHLNSIGDVLKESPQISLTERDSKQYSNGYYDGFNEGRS